MPPPPKSRSPDSPARSAHTSVRPVRPSLFDHWRRRLRRGLCLIPLAALALGLFAVQIGANALLHSPRRGLEPQHRAMLAHPGDYGLRVRPFTVPVADGFSLQALEITAAPEAQWGPAKKARAMRDRLRAHNALPPRPPGTILLSHGRGGIKEHHLPIAERFVAAGFRCLAYDLRGHGQSGGTMTTYGCRERRDLSAVLDAADLPPGEPVFGFGVSLGAAVLLQTLPEEPRLRRAVAVAPFADLVETARLGAQKRVPFSVPGVFEASLWWAGRRGGFDPWQICPESCAARVAQPTLIVHGDRDAVIPPGQGRRIYEALACPGKRWLSVPGGTHGAVLATGGDDLYEEIILFFLQSVPRVETLATRR